MNRRMYQGGMGTRLGVGRGCHRVLPSSYILTTVHTMRPYLSTRPHNSLETSPVSPVSSQFLPRKEHHGQVSRQTLGLQRKVNPVAGTPQVGRREVHHAKKFGEAERIRGGTNNFSGVWLPRSSAAGERSVGLEKTRAFPSEGVRGVGRFAMNMFAPVSQFSIYSGMSERHQTRQQDNQAPCDLPSAKGFVGCGLSCLVVWHRPLIRSKDCA